MLHDNGKMPDTGVESIPNRFKNFVNGVISTMQKIIIKRPFNTHLLKSIILAQDKLLTTMRHKNALQEELINLKENRIQILIKINENQAKLIKDQQARLTNLEG